MSSTAVEPHADRHRTKHRTDHSAESETRRSFFDQPKSVWAVAFACVVSFMGIGLVDPILPTMASQLHATPAQISLLFTSYLLVTAVAMLVTGWVSSRIGAKKTLITGLIIIVVFAALAGSSSGVNGIIGFRAGWGLGNALFIATSLAVIVGAASGGFEGAIVLYEAALGLGIALGPLIGGVLGGISWRGPFFGVAALMAIALVLVSTLLSPTPKPAQKASISAPLKALRYRGLLTVSLTALLYNWGFFTILGYAPYPMKIGVHQLGFVFFGWGLLVATFAVFVAPRAQRAIGTAKSLYLTLFLMSLDVAAIAIWVDKPWVVILCVIISGAFIGMNNTLVTATVMLVAPVPRPTASAAYSFVRFIGGGIAPFVAGTLAARYGDHLPFAIGAGAVFLGMIVAMTAHRFISQAGQHEVETEVELIEDDIEEELEAFEGNLVHGYLTRPNGSPLSEAAVTLIHSDGTESVRGRTGADGSFQLAGAEDGSYLLVGAAAGFHPVARRVLLIGEPQEFTLAPEVAGRLQGRITGRSDDGAEQPVAATVVLLDEHGSVIAREVTDNLGQYAFDGIKTGSYTMAAGAPNCRPNVELIRMPADEVVERDLTLDADPEIGASTAPSPDIAADSTADHTVGSHPKHAQA